MRDSAYVDYGRLINNYPNSARIYFSRGLYNFEQKKYKEAKSDFSKAIILQPNNFNYYLNKGDCFKLLNEKDSMIFYYQYALKVAPDNLNSINRYAEGLDFYNDYDTSSYYYQKSMEIDTSLRSVLTNKIAENYNKIGKYQSSINICNKQIKFITNEFDLIDIRYQRAVANFNLCNYVLSENDLEIIIQNHGSLEYRKVKNYFLREAALNKVQFQDILFLLARSQYFQKKYEQCIKNCQVLIENKKYQSGIVNEMLINATQLIAVAQTDTKKYTHAIKSYESLIELDSTEWIYFNNKSDCLMSLKLYDEATAGFENSIKLILKSESHLFSIDLPKPWFNLGHCYFMLGNYFLSIRTYFDGLKIFFGFTFWPFLILILGTLIRKKICMAYRMFIA